MQTCLNVVKKRSDEKKKTPYPGNINFQRKFRFSYSDGFPGKIRWFSYPSNKKTTEKTSLPPLSVRVRCVAADSIYANNANRKFCTKYGISTSFVRKGRAAKDEPLRKVLRSELSKERATRLEGSFGTQKQHYSLSRIKARNRKTEILWIFFGIHTANAILMIEKIRNKTAKAA